MMLFPMLSNHTPSVFFLSPSAASSSRIQATRMLMFIRKTTNNGHVARLLRHEGGDGLTTGWEGWHYDPSEMAQ